MDGEDEEWSGQQQRKRVCGVDARKARTPEIARSDCLSCVGVDQDESGKHEKEGHTDITDRRKAPIRCRSKDSADRLHVKHKHMKSREKAQ